jgi:hypothetical protein
LLVPIINAEQSVAEGPCPLPVSPAGSTEAALRACVRAVIDQVTAVHASLDGKQLTNLGQYRVSSRLFSFTAVAGNAFGLPVGPTQSVADGYWLFIHPLPVGEHTLVFGGDAPALGFQTEVTYHLRVVPRGRG